LKTFFYFLNKTAIVQERRTRIDKGGCIKLKSFCTSKETITRVKRQSTEWEKIFASYSLDKGLIARTYIRGQKIKHQENNPITKWTNELNRQFSKAVQMANKHMKKHP
jgi:hypothetical protein